MAAWSAFFGSLLFASIGMLRLPKAAVVASRSKKFRISLPRSLSAGEAYVPPGRNVAVFQDAGGVYAISLVCTHLGCIVKPGPQGFECPCHGSHFGPDGSVLGGPAPRGLPWRAVSMDGNDLIIDDDATVPPGTKVKA